MIRLNKIVEGQNGEECEEVWINPYQIKYLTRVPASKSSFLYLHSDVVPLYIKESPEEVALYIKKFYEKRL